jgi:hypothetical protein
VDWLEEDRYESARADCATELHPDGRLVCEAALEYETWQLSHFSLEDLAEIGRQAADSEEAPLPYDYDACDLLRAYNDAVTQITAKIAAARSEADRRTLLEQREALLALCLAWCPEGARPWDDGVEDLTTPPARALVQELSRWIPRPPRRPARTAGRLHQRILVPRGRHARRAHCGGRRRPGSRRTRSSTRGDPSGKAEPGEPPGDHHHLPDRRPSRRVVAP